ncbi:MAG: type II secretion system F family protein [Akkermansiaceae bacterium]|nr:type II secretion system F family protein [Akkermansiaceae bacterium]MDP4847836.1 type II secretion system F family protein [Akkermansiaceae bacterium]MDP4995025.1 type II secretion system F family protein [Akkermansiaceae bacterium]
MTRDATNKQLFYTEMSKLLEAGFDIRKAAGVMGNSRLPAAQAKLLVTINAGLESGQTIAGAFAADEGVGKLERSMIAAGERGGKLGRAFGHLAGYFGMVAASRREVIRGMIYPLILLHLGVFVAKVPMQMMGGEADIGDLFVGLLATLAVIYVVAVAGFFLICWLQKRAAVDVWADKIFAFIPWVGKARRNMAMSRFCKVYHACLLAGIPMRETVQVSADSSQSGRLLAAGKRIEAIAVEGNALGPGYMAETSFPAAFSRSYSNGEEAGTLDKDMEVWSRVFQEDAESSVRMASLMIPKVFYFMIMGFVAWKIVSFFTGYYGMLDSIGE